MTKLTSRRAVLKVAGMAPLAWLAGSGISRGQAPDIINVGLSPYINQATLFIAKETGLFSKVGVDVRMKIFMDGALVVAPMVSGEVSIGVMTSSAGLFNSFYRGGPYRAFLCNGQGRRGRAVTCVVVRSDHYNSGVRTIKDLAKMKGKIAAVGALGSINQYGMGSALHAAGLDPVNDVRWQTSVPQPDIVKQLGQKQVDIAEITYHLAYLAQKQGFCRIIASRDEILPDSQTAVMTARDEMFEKQKDLLVRYAMACIHAGRQFNRIAGDPTKYPQMLELIAKSIIPHDQKLLTAVAPHWSWIAENGRPNVDSVMQQQDFWADTFKLVEHKVPRARVFVADIADAATRRLATEKPFG
jgi:NitT/TauT family transport system substrate-binding protein